MTMWHVAHPAIAVPGTVVFLSFDVFVIVWLAMAWRTKKKVFRQPAAEARAYAIPLLLGIALLTPVLRFVPPVAFLAAPFYRLSPALAWVAAGLAVAGLVLALWSRFALGRNWSGQVTLKEGHELVTSGPYAAVRHPIYTALILLFGGFAVLLASVSAWLGWALMTVSFWIKLRQEEALMLRQFPDGYPAYMARTKRLFPALI
jgi:protein-S-isoprenylcysteine O-methyltransferase Ste14